MSHVIELLLNLIVAVTSWTSVAAVVVACAISFCVWWLFPTGEYRGAVAAIAWVAGFIFGLLFFQSLENRQVNRRQ